MAYFRRRSPIKQEHYGAREHRAGHKFERKYLCFADGHDRAHRVRPPVRKTSCGRLICEGCAQNIIEKDQDALCPMDECDYLERVSDMLFAAQFLRVRLCRHI